MTCDKCPSHSYNDEIGRSLDCTDCPAGYIADKIGSASCQACPLGQFGLTWKGKMFCDKCPRGFVRTKILPPDSLCEECPKGWYMGSIGQQHCVQCSAGQFNAMTGQKYCQKCPIGWSRADGVNTDDDSACDECELGQHTDRKTGSTDCVQCEVGQYGDERGSCKDCATQTFQSAKGKTTCKPCELGQGFVNKATECSKCDIGKYGITPGNCASCMNETFSDTKGEILCKDCPSGSQPNEKFTACELVPWKVPKDCHPTLQYLDDSSADKMEWQCKACPYGGWCSGEEVTWLQVRAKQGFWRVHHQRSNIPPDCLSRKVDVASPTCAFERCLSAEACIGVIDSTSNSTTLTQIEDDGCDVAAGYAQHCVGGYLSSKDGTKKKSFSLELKTTCRLCATCKEGFKRSGSSTRCKKCPESSENRALLAVGVVVMVFGTACLIYFTIKADGGHDNVSDAMKKIILNFLQVISLAGGLPLQVSLSFCFCFCLILFEFFGIFWNFLDLFVNMIARRN